MQKPLTAWFCFLILLGFTACETPDPYAGYGTVGQFDQRTAAETAGLKQLLSQYATLPAQGVYKIKYRFTDAQGLTGTNEHAIWYDKSQGQLAVEFDILSGTSCRWNGVDQAALQALVTANVGLQGANQVLSPTNQQADCFTP